MAVHGSYSSCELRVQLHEFPWIWICVSMNRTWIWIWTSWIVSNMNMKVMNMNMNKNPMNMNMNMNIMLMNMNIMSMTMNVRFLHIHVNYMNYSVRSPFLSPISFATSLGRLMNMNSEINMNPWIWICVFPWTHEFYICQLDEPMNFISGKSMNPWIWKLTMLWTHEYEYQIPYELLNMNMDTLLCELLKVHTAHEILWTMPWTPWIVMREYFIAKYDSRNTFKDDFPTYRTIHRVYSKEIWLSWELLLNKYFSYRKEYCSQTETVVHSTRPRHRTV